MGNSHYHRDSRAFASCAFLACCLAVTAHQGTASGNVSVSDICSAWGDKNRELKAVSYSITGTAFIPKHSREMPDGERFPSEDFSGGLDVRLVLDFENNRVRRYTSRTLYNLDEKRFIPEVLVDLYDGSAFQQFIPRDENLGAGREMQLYESELVQGDNMRRSFVLRVAESPLFLHLGLIPFSSTEPAQLRVSPRPDEFSMDGIGLVGGRECLRVRHSRPETGSKWSVYWVDPDRDFAV